MENNTPLELYIHIPFCVKKCLYCDFLSFAADEGTRKKYVEQLIKEIETGGTRKTGRDARGSASGWISNGTTVWSGRA